jgi:hypothetical protein
VLIAKKMGAFEKPVASQNRLISGARGQQRGIVAGPERPAGGRPRQVHGLEQFANCFIRAVGDLLYLLLGFSSRLIYCVSKGTPP